MDSWFIAQFSLFWNATPSLGLCASVICLNCSLLANNVIFWYRFPLVRPLGVLHSTGSNSGPLWSSNRATMSFPFSVWCKMCGHDITLLALVRIALISSCCFDITQVERSRKWLSWYRRMSVWSVTLPGNRCFVDDYKQLSCLSSCAIFASACGTIQEEDTIAEDATLHRTDAMMIHHFAMRAFYTQFGAVCREIMNLSCSECTPGVSTCSVLFFFVTSSCLSFAQLLTHFNISIRTY